MIEPKDLELGKGERAVWLEELVKYRERGWFAFFFFLVAPGGGSWSWSLSWHWHWSAAMQSCEAIRPGVRRGRLNSNNSSNNNILHSPVCFGSKTLLSKVVSSSYIVAY